MTSFSAYRGFFPISFAELWGLVLSVPFLPISLFVLLRRLLPLPVQAAGTILGVTLSKGRESFILFKPPTDVAFIFPPKLVLPTRFHVILSSQSPEFSNPTQAHILESVPQIFLF